MITQKYREYDFTKYSTNHYLIVGKSNEQIFDELREFANLHREDSIYYYMNPVRPGKPIPTPEYSMEILVDMGGVNLFWIKYQ